MNESPRQRVAIIGGGPAALAAAFELTSDGRDSDYDVTIYQQGWRLGGKCASGRNPDAGFGDRIEEHGLHIWFGCYQNVRRVLERCYRDLPDIPWNDFADAFEGVDTIVLGQRTADDWEFNELIFPRNRNAPLNFGDFVSEALRWATQKLVTLRGEMHHEASQPWWEGTWPLLQDLDVEEPHEGERLHGVSHGASRLSRELTTMYLDLRAAGERVLDPGPHIGRFEALVESVLPRQPGEPAEVTFYRDTVRILFAVLRGVWDDRLLERGFNAINDEDLAGWLRRHGLELEADPLRWPALVRAVYDGCFAFCDGDPRQPSMAAGRALQGAIRCLFHYEGSVLYRPRGSMSDVLIRPLAQCLAKRKVKVCYFHAALRLRPSDDARRVGQVELVRQVSEDVITSVTNGGVPTAWPTKLPDSLGIESSERLEREINPFGSDARVVLDDREPNGFDWVILAVPPDVQRQICCELREADAGYARMLDNAASVVTQASQLWLRRTATELGQGFPSDSLLSCFVESLDTYADMAHLRAHEQWTDDEVQHIAYFCGVLPQNNLTSQAEADASAERELRRFLTRDVHRIWPESVTRGTEAFDAELLVPSVEGRLEHALGEQYSRANWAPTERYVLTLPGSVPHRLPARGTRFANLVLAGDWTANGFDAGCLEAAVTSGRLAAQAISGLPRADDIPGVNGPPGCPSVPRGAPHEDGLVDQVAHVVRLAAGLGMGGLRLARMTVEAVLRRAH